MMLRLSWIERDFTEANNSHDVCNFSGHDLDNEMTYIDL